MEQRQPQDSAVAVAATTLSSAFAVEHSFIHRHCTHAHRPLSSWLLLSLRTQSLPSPCRVSVRLCDLSFDFFFAPFSLSRVRFTVCPLATPIFSQSLYSLFKSSP